ncbi:MAG: tRNA (adenosine(37)-N6)-dimethylallyltransferase MiaA [Nitrospinaceae bacterium]|jgi:tRNA dimethylallyltransferase|nr:tRNA (adenosine(37)-N6)-dimethylallyltransferase MiaA [Nitrospinaceae bacterium]MBT3432542.1 tRNA (adenosine(37)-N6)-dimethylallyltransferase MiaA [Nitrospinaceae bacterium]MBT4092602.1 tRNA (adenosine(37)-N6)-dimethylallyltransferase MiaA [Nitrospinaceae bacterium]MBT4431899.1 tRNA (adenosine(37)-N6)-dimethylallyltransferase MiaA [Nitrospinaceae bacterium]MBT5949027.1 tRNA (adenosine(37)-N6)-dimethylallyltransferase MiaA [Nitrospinaceae bacterium]
MSEGRATRDWRPIAVMVGATCSGKTTLAAALAGWLGERDVPIEIIGADARQIYRSLSIGTAKPTLEERDVVPHHMIDVAEPDETFNASRYAEEALECAERIYDKGAFPMVVGGSGLYIQALIEGLFDGPGADENIRLKLEEQAERDGAEALHRSLVECDPAAAGKIHPNDTKRVIRALEVYEVTGRPISELRAESPAGGFARPFYVGLDWPSDTLDERIKERIRWMLLNGMQDEASWLSDAGLADARSFEGLGYEDALALHCGEIAFDDCLTRISTLHRQYAKRQRTWGRRIEDVHWFEPSEMSFDALILHVGESLLSYFHPAQSQGTVAGR